MIPEGARQLFSFNVVTLGMLIARNPPGKDYTDKEIDKRYLDFFKADERDEKPDLTDDQISYYRDKWEALSEFVRDIKQGFSRFYNKRHNRRGFFWAERFKSVIVDNGDTLINCLAYIDLNPVRAGIVEKPEEYYKAFSRLVPIATSKIQL